MSRTITINPAICNYAILKFQFPSIWPSMAHQKAITALLACMKSFNTTTRPPYKSTRKIACIAKPVTSKTRSKISIGYRLKAAVGRSIQVCSISMWLILNMGHINIPIIQTFYYGVNQNKSSSPAPHQLAPKSLYWPKSTASHRA